MANLVALACNVVSRAGRASLQQEAAADSRSERRFLGATAQGPPWPMMLALRLGQNQ